jgi:hypothetical protein
MLWRLGVYAGRRIADCSWGENWCRLIIGHCFYSQKSTSQGLLITAGRGRLYRRIGRHTVHRQAHSHGHQRGSSSFFSEAGEGWGGGPVNRCLNVKWSELKSPSLLSRIPKTAHCNPDDLLFRHSRKCAAQGTSEPTCCGAPGRARFTSASLGLRQLSIPCKKKKQLFSIYLFWGFSGFRVPHTGAVGPGVVAACSRFVQILSHRPTADGAPAAPPHSSAKSAVRKRTS